MTKTPVDALDDAIFAGIIYDGGMYPKPGQIIEKLKPETREALSKLTSEDAQNMRPDIWIKK